MLSERYDHALVFAHKIHREQVRKGTKIPYISHLVAVSALALEADGTEDHAIGALLHDSIEDSATNYPGGAEALRENIREKFGQAVLDIVEHCTDADTEPKPPWRERKEAYIASIGQKPDDALLVSCADKLHNARAILLDYRTHGEKLWERFNAGRESLWYYRALVKAFIDTGRAPSMLTGELERVVRELHELAGEPYQ